MKEAMLWAGMDGVALGDHSPGGFQTSNSAWCFRISERRMPCATNRIRHSRSGRLFANLVPDSETSSCHMKPCMILLEVVLSRCVSMLTAVWPGSGRYSESGGRWRQATGPLAVWPMYPAGTRSATFLLALLQEGPCAKIGAVQNQNSEAAFLAPAFRAFWQWEGATSCYTGPSS